MWHHLWGFADVECGGSDRGIYLKLHAETGKHQWNWTKEFVIVGKEANSLNKKAVTSPNGNGVGWYLAACLTVIILILLVYIHKLRKQILQNNHALLPLEWISV